MSNDIQVLQDQVRSMRRAAVRYMNAIGKAETLRRTSCGDKLEAAEDELSEAYFDLKARCRED